MLIDNDRLLLVRCVYLPPDDMAAYTSFSSKMADLSLVDDSYVLVCGDFNLSTTQWLRQGDNRYLDPLHIEQKYSQLIFNLSFHGCIQFNDVFNYNNRLLDLIFSNKNNISELIHCTNALVQEDAYHPCVEFLYNFWKFVNGRKGKSCIPAVMHFGDIRSTTGEDIVNLFAEYFSKMYSDRDYAVQDTLASGDANLSKFEISISSIYEKLSTLDINKGPGPDGLPPLLLKLCSFLLSRPLHIIFNLSLKTGTFPTF